MLKSPHIPIEVTLLTRFRFDENKEKAGRKSWKSVFFSRFAKRFSTYLQLGPLSILSVLPALAKRSTLKVEYFDEHCLRKAGTVEIGFYYRKLQFP